MSDASAVAATSTNWINQVRSDPFEFLKSLDDLLEKFGAQSVGNGMAQQYMKEFTQNIREIINDSNLPPAMKDAANTVLDAHASSMSDLCPCSAEIMDAVTSSQQSGEISQLAETEAEAMAEALNESSSAPTSGASPTSSVSPEAQAEADAEAVNEGTATSTSSNPGADMAQLGNEGLEEGGKGDKPGGGSGNWLIALAETLSKIQAKFLDAAMAASRTMEATSDDAVVGGGGTASASEDGTAGADASQSSEFLIAQGQFTANMQLFNLFANQTATALKTLGEGLAGIARKQ